MADTKFSQFDTAATLTGAEKVVGLQSGDNVQIGLSIALLPFLNSNVQLASTAQVTGLDAALAGKLALAGGTMTGLLILSADPAVALGAATKQYVDASSASVSLQNAYDHSAGYPDAVINIPSNGSISILEGSNTPFAVDNSGIFSSVGLGLDPGTGEDIAFLITGDSAAIIQVTSTLRGVKIFGDMTTAERDAIIGQKPVGMGIYNIQQNTLNFWTTDSAWMALLNDTYAQTVNGVKSFTSSIIGNLTGNADTATIAATASAANTISTSQASTNATFYLAIFASSTNGYQAVRLGTGMGFNPFTNNLTTTTFTGALVGNADTATTATTATNATNVATTSTTTNASFFLAFAPANSTANQALNVTAGVSVNASTKILTATGFAGTSLTSTDSINGTALTMRAGNASGGGAGGNALLNGGGAGNSGNGGDLILTGGTTGTGGIAGNVRIRGGLAPSGTAGAVIFDQGNVNFANATQLVFGSAVANILTINSATGATNRADVILNRFDSTNGFARLLFLTNGVSQWSNGIRSGSNNFVVFDEVNVIAQLTVAQGSGITGVSTFAGTVTINSTTTALTIQNGAAINAKNSGGTSEIFMYPRFSDNKTYMDIGSAGATFRQDAAGATWLSVDTSSNVTFNTGNILLSTAGKTVTLKTGVNAASGTVTLSGTTTTVNTSAATTGDLIVLTVSAPGGTQGFLSYSISTGVSFTITSTLGATDTSTVKWAIIHQN